MLAFGFSPGMCVGGNILRFEGAHRHVWTASEGGLQKVKEACIQQRVFPLPGTYGSPQTFHQVTVAWKHLKHPNIVPLLGVTIDPPQLISDHTR